MYQTVGHQGIELFAEAMGLPLFQQPTQGVALLQEQVYTPTPEDEVEDLFQLLKTVKVRHLFKFVMTKGSSNVSLSCHILKMFCVRFTVILL